LLSRPASESTAASRPFEALDLSFRNPANAGFIREDAVLAVVFVTATDDASTGEIATRVARPEARYADPSRIIVSAISAPRIGSNPCGAAAAPRLHAFLDGFPHHNAAALICDDDFDAISIGPLFKTTVGLPCWELAPLDLDDRPGEQRACSAFLTTPAYGEYIDVVIRECGSTPTSPCWRIAHEPLCGEGGNPPLTTLLEPIRWPAARHVRGHRVRGRATKWAESVMNLLPTIDPDRQLCWHLVSAVRKVSV
jgi:hypothetical protein